MVGNIAADDRQVHFGMRKPRALRNHIFTLREEKNLRVVTGGVASQEILEDLDFQPIQVSRMS